MRCETAPKKYTVIITCPVLSGVAIPGLFFFTLGGAIALQLNPTTEAAAGVIPSQRSHEIYKGFF